MLINADVKLPARVDGAVLPWVDSPLPGVQRRMFERDGDEVARVTSIVRYAPGSHFSPHVHTGGEEFLVLDGVFSDEHGDYPAGSYIRNPVGSRHTPGSADGCTIFVKLRWMFSQDQAFVRLTPNEQTGWVRANGCEMFELHAWGAEENLLVRLAAGESLYERTNSGGEEIFVLTGEGHDAIGPLRSLHWQRTPPGPARALTADTDMLIYIKRGHLADPVPTHS